MFARTLVEEGLREQLLYGNVISLAPGNSDPVKADGYIMVGHSGQANTPRVQVVDFTTR